MGLLHRILGPYQPTDGHTYTPPPDYIYRDPDPATGDPNQPEPEENR